MFELVIYSSLTNNETQISKNETERIKITNPDTDRDVEERYRRAQFTAVLYHTQSSIKETGPWPTWLKPVLYVPVNNLTDFFFIRGGRVRGKRGAVLKAQKQFTRPHTAMHALM